MAKMFYTTEEAAARLGATPDQVKQFITENKLREFRDGARVMFKVDQVDRLATDLKSGSGGDSIGLAPASAGSDSGIDLAPAGSGSSVGGMDAISLADTSGSTVSNKEDTVVTGVPGKIKSQGSGVTKSPGDSSAQTQIQSAIDDQFSLEGVGSGSGLLDLTRERDDTSLGAELLDEIYPGGETAKSSEGGIGSSSGIFEQSSAAEMLSGPSGLEHIAATTPSSAPVGQAEIVEAYDSSSGLFGGMALAGTLVMAFTLLVVALDFQDIHPDWVTTLTADGTKTFIFAGVLVLVSILLSLVGLFWGKAAR
jgi:excisionase family DNA binding protein